MVSQLLPSSQSSDVKQQSGNASCLRGSEVVPQVGKLIGGSVRCTRPYSAIARLTDAAAPVRMQSSQAGSASGLARFGIVLGGQFFARREPPPHRCRRRARRCRRPAYVPVDPVEDESGRVSLQGRPGPGHRNFGPEIVVVAVDHLRRGPLTVHTDSHVARVRLTSISLTS